MPHSPGVASGHKAPKVNQSSESARSTGQRYQMCLAHRTPESDLSLRKKFVLGTSPTTFRRKHATVFHACLCGVSSIISQTIDQRKEEPVAPLLQRWKIGTQLLSSRRRKLSISFSRDALSSAQGQTRGPIYINLHKPQTVTWYHKTNM